MLLKRLLILFLVSMTLVPASHAQLFQEDFGTFLTTLDAVKWPSTCRTSGSYNTSLGACSGTNDRSYSISGFGTYVTTMGIAIPTTGYTLDFEYMFDYFSFSAPDVEIRTGGPCGTIVAGTTTLPVAASCTPYSIDLSAYIGQTIYVRFVSNTSSATTYIDNIIIDGGGAGPSGDFKWADNFNDNDLVLDYAGTDGDEACSGCGNWTLGAGATLELVPSGGWNGNSNETEAFPDNMSNVYYAKLDRDEYIESPTIDMSAQESLKISFYAKSSSSGTGGGDTWSGFSDHLRLQIWDGSAWITVKDITEGAFADENKISPALPFNYFCFTAYKSNTSPGNYYYSATPNVNSAYFHSDFKFRVIFEGGFSGAPFAWVDDFTFRADADGFSTMIPCGISFWNQPAATSYGMDTGTTGNNNAEKGVELELDNSINIPPNWSTEADDGDTVSQIFGSGESERVVFAVISEQRIQFSFPRVHFYAPDDGWNSATLSVDNNYSGPGWRYYNVQYISCDLTSSTIAEPTDDYRYYYSFEYGNEFIPVFYHLNTSGIETGGGATASYEVFNAPDVISLDDCGLVVLSADFSDFEIVHTSTGVQLDWNTLSEVNNSYFEIQRSFDGSNFIPIGKVNGSGTTQQLQQYSWMDRTPQLGLNYYRIKQVDYNGDYSFSEVRQLSIEDCANTLFPNPVNDELNVSLCELDSGELTITNSQGIIVERISVKENQKMVKINTSQLSEGIYIVHINSEEGDRILRFQKL